MSASSHGPFVSLPPGFTHREARYISMILAGKNKADAGRMAGLPEWMWRDATRKIETPAITEIIETCRAELAELALLDGLVDAQELHQYLTDAIRADMSDIRNDDHTFKPMSEWPLIWRQMAEAGDVDVEMQNQRSHDGQTKDKQGGWDITGAVLKVKYRFGSRAKWIEMAMKHKAVDAFIQPAPAKVEINDNRVQVAWIGEGEK